MFVSINGQRQMSFEEFAKTFQEAFQRELTSDEQWYFSQSDFSDSEVTTHHARTVGISV